MLKYFVFGFIAIGLINLGAGIYLFLETNKLLKNVQSVEGVKSNMITA